MKSIIRYDKRHRQFDVLCSEGHVLEVIQVDGYYAGSNDEANLSFRHEGDIFERMAEQCERYH